MSLVNARARAVNFNGVAGRDFDLVNLVPVGHRIAERMADRLPEARLLPAEEYNDGLILAKAALLGCAILPTGDAHLRGLDFQRASLELKAFDVEMPVIATPRELVAKFFAACCEAIRDDFGY